MDTSGDAVRVLYVGDRPGSREFAESVAEAEAFTVVVADEDEALDRVETGAFDCVVGDVDEGLELLDSVRDDHDDLPYVFVASEGHDVADEALTRGATDYVERRSDREQRALLVTRVENAVVRRTAGGLVGSLVTKEAPEDDYARITTELRENETYLRKLYRTASNTELAFEQKRRRLLELGRERLGVDVGFVSHIEGDTFEIADSVGSHELLQPGETAPLAETYCRKTLDDGGLLSVEDAESAGWGDDTTYRSYGLGCYVGAKVFVDGDLRGTLCFADQNPRQRSFSENEKIYVELISQWLCYEREQVADERALREKNRRLEEFASVVSHDLRNPLNVAQIYLSMAEESGDREDFEQVRCAHDRMEQLIQNLLTLAREGDALTDVTERNLSAVADDARGNVETDRATVRIEGDVTVEADRERLKQLLENLFRNSIEHTDGDVTVRVGPLDGGHGFYVADNGPGIPEDERDRVFDHGYSTDDEGTGLGLAIVRRVAEAHDWTVSVAKSESDGARFEVECDG